MLMYITASDVTLALGSVGCDVSAERRIISAGERAVGQPLRQALAVPWVEPPLIPGARFLVYVTEKLLMR